MTKPKTLPPRLVAAALSTSLHGIATEMLRGGDDSLYRELTVGSTRFTVQCMSVEPDPYSKSMAAMVGRKRKFSNPLFITPSGLLHSFPQTDADLFVDIETARVATKRHGEKGQWEIFSTTLALLTKTKAFQRWLAEVASLPEGSGYAEPRRSLEETFAIYTQEGMDGLRRHYTRSHAFHLIAKFKEQGLM